MSAQQQRPKGPAGDEVLEELDTVEAKMRELRSVVTMMAACEKANREMTHAEYAWLARVSRDLAVSLVPIGAFLYFVRQDSLSQLIAWGPIGRAIAESMGIDRAGANDIIEAEVLAGRLMLFPVSGSNPPTARLVNTNGMDLGEWVLSDRVKDMMLKSAFKTAHGAGGGT